MEEKNRPLGGSFWVRNFIVLSNDASGRTRYSSSDHANVLAEAQRFGDMATQSPDQAHRTPRWVTKKGKSYGHSY
jgi:hypothetical protein